jgi:hypothetical protein
MTPTGDLGFSCAGLESTDAEGRSGDISPWGQHVGPWTLLQCLDWLISFAAQFFDAPSPVCSTESQSGTIKLTASGAHFFGHFLMALSGRRPVDGVTQKYMGAPKLCNLPYRRHIVIGNGGDMRRMSNALVCGWAVVGSSLTQLRSQC